MLSWELTRRFMRKSSGLLSLSTGLSVFGMSLGVASMLVSMAVVSGYETTLKKAVVDLTGHLVLSKVGGWRTTEELDQVLSKIPEMKSSTTFVYAEAALVHGGKLSGVLLEGVDETSVHSVLHLEDRLKEGTLSFLPQEGLPAVLMGKALARKHGLRVGDRFRVALPSMGDESTRPPLKEFMIAGIIDMGRHDYDSRYILADLRTVQTLAGAGGSFSGARVRVGSPEEALEVAFRLRRDLDLDYRVRTWRDVNSNLFDAFDIEKPVIFFVLLVIVIAASFNVATTIFVSVFRRYRDISVLKSLGARPRTIIALFTGQGLFIGTLGSVMGGGLALLLAQGFVWMQNRWTLLPGEVYKIDYVMLDWRLGDILSVIFAAALISFLASLGPATRGAKLPPVEGLRYE